MEMIDIAAAVSLPQVSVDSSSSSSWSPLYGGGAHLDQEAIQYIHKFYCKDCRMEAEKAKAAAAEGTSPKEGEEEKPTSPQSTLEEMSLQQSMDKNKESLKRKLMMRRSVNELVDQGIYPPLKTPAAFAEQRKSLERAKTGDLLRYKISHRPDRQQLVQQHILEDTKIDPSLHERQRLLKRARLVDDLNDKLNHRPGPLDLMKGNILKTEDDQLLEALQDGSIPYIPKDDDHPFTFDDDSNTSEGGYSPSQYDDSGMSDIGSPPIIPPAPSPPNQKQQKLLPTSNFQTNVAKLPVVTTQTFSISNPANLITSGGNYSFAQVKNGNSNSHNFVTKVRPKKSNRPKTQTKSKVIKFHEYKGPPNVVKSTNPTTTPTPVQPDKNETPYHILLQQQQLFLQWQLEFNGSPPINVNNLDKFDKSSMIITSTATTSPINVTSPTLLNSSPGHFQTISQETVTSPTTLGQPQLASQGNIVTPSMSATPLVQTKLPPPTVVPSSTSPICQPPVQLSTSKLVSKVVTQKPLANLEDMKVTDLKAELKKRNLPVSGPKPQLIERLKPYADTIITNSSNIASKNISALSKLPVQAIVNVKKFPVVKSDDISMSNNSPTSPRSLESFMPLSPEIMEMVTSPQASIITSPQVNNNNISTSQSNIPMAVDNSRPPSVAPTEMAMDVDQNSLSPSSSTITLATSPTQQQVQLIPLEQTQSQQIQIVQQPQQSPTPKPGEPLTPEQLIREEMLQQQRFKISELQRQLEESHRRLKLQQMQHQHLQQQQQQLNQLQQQTAQLNQLQQQTQLLQQPTSPPMAVSSQMLQQPTSPPLMVNSSMSPQSGSNPPSVKANVIQPTSPSQALNSGVSVASPPAQILSVSQPVSEGTTTILQIPLNALQNATQLNTIKTSVQPGSAVTNSNIKSQIPKVSMTNLFNNRVLHQSLNMGNPTTSLSSLINIQPLSTGSGKTINLPPLNGLTQLQQRAISVPSSPVEGKTNIARAKSNPFFIPSKEPPRYDEAVKNMHNLAQGGHIILKSEPGVLPNTSSMTKSISTPIIKSQAMDDVLEILIRNGELPPSAAQEPPPTPKTTPQSVSTSTISSATSSFGELTSSSGGHFPQFTMTLASTMPTTSTTSVTDVVSSLLNSSPPMSVVKNEPITPPASVAMTTTSDICTSDILDINEMLNQDLSSMDWTSDSPFTQIDLNEGTCLPSELIDKNNQSKDFLHVPSGENVTNKGTGHGSEPDITGLGINDLESSQNMNMQMDVSDWLDVIMPSTGLTPLSANAPVAFPSDPILTPKTQQEVFDLFNFEDTDFSQADMQSGLNWEKLTEANIN